MDEIKLDVQIRKEVGTRKIKPLRTQDLVPAVVYGGEHGPTNIKVKRSSYEKIMRLHKGQSVVFHLNVSEGDKKIRDYSAILKTEQIHPVSDRLLHVDFQRISLTQEIEVKVQITPRGEAIGVKQDGGSLDQTMWEVDVVCLPTNIPEQIEIDISELKIGDSIHVKDLPLPSDVTTKHDPESMVVSVVPPMKEEDESAEDGDQEPEVIGEKKESEDGGEEKAEESGDAPAEENKEEKSE